MTKDQSVRGIKKAGRPAGSGHGHETIVRLRAELTEALNILDRGGRPLSQLLAENLEKDAPRTLQAIGRYLPTNVTLEAGDGFLSALQAVGAAIAEERDDPVPVMDVSITSVGRSSLRLLRSATPHSRKQAKALLLI